MRWKTSKWGDKRVITKFLFLPVSIKGEVRWLETATIRQERRTAHWSNKEFVDNEKDEKMVKVECARCGGLFDCTWTKYRRGKKHCDICTPSLSNTNK